ncbi:MAG TPA: 50S ribosomal protein L3 [Spirochaetota bacterium]|nr:50S ribosomal protein L3 [Spirochaetota bacterium]OPZ38047.1 MAG: 50S ribosomal protein L3 [Spirochaetes bacterium ADurb.BinA120]HNU91918.1 50S ribosomal protein L3 [Spirochaetota bacterium]HPO46333.1 50S ribosomal protein L3 [Spirochaetota bacterium]HPV97668.1 50S ribosomal protein L3 [Spirochaetota bacterium]
MKKALIGRKIGMSQHIAEDGTMVPVTVCTLGPCVVVQKKTPEKDGYSALKLGFEDVPERKLTRPLLSDLKRKNIAPKRVLGEVEIFDESLDVGSVVTCEIFAENQVVTVTGITKGKGFTGAMKRHGFGGGRKTHGSDFHRAPGSIGAHTYPGEVWKGKKMPGRDGGGRVTVKNLKIVKVLKDRNIVLISGAIPGRKDSLITVKEK